MANFRLITGILLAVLIAPVMHTMGQEFAGPILWNPFQKKNNVAVLPAARTTATTLSLPFFEDFTGYSPTPDSSKWVDGEVYINNTMGVNVISRGVATFDDLDAHGTPYDSFNVAAIRYADSLTSQFIDLGANSPADSVYLSFFYQPQGNGFYPLIDDSLMVYMKNRYGDFVKVWSVPGTTLTPFQQAMIPITDTLYFHNGFQFRFVNRAALYWADAVWNVDYVRLDRNRSITDTAVNDVAFTSNPSFLLNDYTFMPYSQFKSSPSSELAPQVTDSFRNNTLTSQSASYTFIVRNLNSGATLAAAGSPGSTVPASQQMQALQPLTVGGLPSYPPNTSVVFQTEFYLQTAAGVGPTENDTIIKNQVFDNYLAYDDGTAEKSYYLKLLPSLAGRLAVEYHLNHPDTLRGMAIYFGRQIPFAYYKLFSIYVYSSLHGVNGATNDVVLDSTDFVYPAYADSVNHFWYYTFPKPLVLPAGVFYAGTMQPFGGSSDSLYFGLDVNRIGFNHAYYNVTGTWTPSLITGAIMMRPLLGHYVSGSAVNDVHAQSAGWQVSPNPATNVLYFRMPSELQAEYRLTDISGHTLLTGKAAEGKSVNISSLPAGMYLVTLVHSGLSLAPQRVIKL